MSIITHPIRFFFAADFALDMGRARDLLPRYVADLNTILRRSGTIRRLTFEPTGGIENRDWHGEQNNLVEQPREFEVHCYIKTAAPSEQAPSSVVDAAGNAQLVNMPWTGIHDPFSTTDMRGYWDQIYKIIHELGHAFGLGSSVELYDLMGRSDNSGFGPNKGLDAMAPSEFWAQRPALKFDPMGLFLYDLPGYPESRTREWLLRYQLFSLQHATAMNRHYRNPSPRIPRAGSILWTGGENARVFLVSGAGSWTEDDPVVPGGRVDASRIGEDCIALCFKTETAGGYVCMFDLEAAALAGKGAVVIEQRGSDIVIANAPTFTLPVFEDVPDDVPLPPAPPVRVTMSKRLELSVGPTIPGRSYRIRSSLQVIGPYREWMTVVAPGERIVLSVDGWGDQAFFTVEVVA